MRKIILHLSLSLLALSYTIFLNAQTIISLGSSCTTASAMRTYGIREAAYPFDWVASNYNALYQVLNDDFEHFFTQLSFAVFNNKDGGVIDHYGMIFMHDLRLFRQSLSI